MYNTSNLPMTLDDVARRFPTIAAETPHASRSDKYRPVNTLSVLRELTSHGFEVFNAQTARVRRADKLGYEKHIVRMRLPGTSFRNVGDVFPEIGLTNSHDGTSAFILFAGMFRLVCANGMTVGTTWGNVRVKHAGNPNDVAAAVIGGAYTIRNTFGRLGDTIERFSARILTEAEERDYVHAAFALRYPSEEDQARAPIEPDWLLLPRRREDVGNDLWRVFNRVQENLLRGGLRGHSIGSDGRTRRASLRSVTSIDNGLTINRGLFDLAERIAA